MYQHMPSSPLRTIGTAFHNAFRPCTPIRQPAVNCQARFAVGSFVKFFASARVPGTVVEFCTISAPARPLHARRVLDFAASSGEAIRATARGTRFVIRASAAVLARRRRGRGALVYICVR